MDSWSKIIKYGGSAAVVALLLYTVIEHLFNKEIVELFGGDRLFFITVLLVFLLLIILLVSILYKSKEVNSKSNNSPSSSPKVTYKDKSSHNGDNNF